MKHFEEYHTTNVWKRQNENLKNHKNVCTLARGGFNSFCESDMQEQLQLDLWRVTPEDDSPLISVSFCSHAACTASSSDRVTLYIAEFIRFEF